MKTNGEAILECANAHVPEGGMLVGASMVVMFIGPDGMPYTEEHTVMDE